MVTPDSSTQFLKPWGIILVVERYSLSSTLFYAHAGSCSQVEIYDAYVVDLDAKRAVAEAKAEAERVRARQTHGS